MKKINIFIIFTIGLIIISSLSIANQFTIDAAVFDAPLLPGTDNLYNLGYVGISGISDQRWQNGFFSGNLTTTGNLSIGTTTISSRLIIDNGNILQKNINNEGIKTINNFLIGTSIYDIYVSGRYAYATFNGLDAKPFKIIDVSNPNYPEIISELQFPAGINPRGLYVSGKYAYIANYVSGSTRRIYIIDVSNVSSPRIESFYDLPSPYRPFDIYVSGRYVYAITTGEGQSDLIIIDISNPSKPEMKGSYTLGATATMLYISGKYAYMTESTSNRLFIIDISDPIQPQLVKNFAMANSPKGIYVSGPYAYVTGNSPDNIAIINISNPANPQIIATLTVGSQPDDIYVAGHYAYITNSNSNNISIIDISSSSSPRFLGNINTSNNPKKIFISGHYAYITHFTNPGNISIIDISGLESVSANIHSLEAGNLQVRNDIIAQGQLQVSGGINVGTGGIFSAGSIGVSISSTTQTDAVSAYFQGRVGIATTTPTQKLEVNGGIRLYGNSESTCDASGSPSTRGTLRFTQGSAGVADKLEICNSSSTAPGGYDWRKLY